MQFEKYFWYLKNRLNVFPLFFKKEFVMKNRFMAISFFVLTVMMSSATSFCMQDSYYEDYMNFGDDNCCGDSVMMDENCEDGSCYDDLDID